MSHTKDKEVLWVTPKFKSFLYERKSKDHKKTFYDIQEDIMRETREREEQIEKEFIEKQKQNKKGVFSFGKL